MKTYRSILILGIAAVVFPSVSLVAGPGLQYWTRSKPVNTVKEADAIGADDIAVMACAACKTILVKTPKHVGPPNKGRDEWFVVGSKHSCDHCGGEMSVVNGKNTNSMQHNCSKCGEGAAFCCVVINDSGPSQK